MRRLKPRLKPPNSPRNRRAPGEAARPPTPRPEQPAPAALQAPLSAYAVLYGNQGNVKRACLGCDADITGKGTAYYHCARPPPRLAKTSIGGVDVCGRCFSAGKLPDGTTSGSFLRTVATGASSKKAKKAARVVSVNEDGEEYEVEDDEDDDDSDAEMEQDDWTDQETLLLLEALETHGESWSDVASHVGTKSAEECIRRFIRLPIEERFLDELDPNVGGTDAADVGAAGTSVPPRSGAWAGRTSTCGDRTTSPFPSRVRRTPSCPTWLSWRRA